MKEYKNSNQGVKRTTLVILSSIIFICFFACQYGKAQGESLKNKLTELSYAIDHYHEDQFLVGRINLHRDLFQFLDTINVNILEEDEIDIYHAFLRSLEQRLLKDIKKIEAKKVIKEQFEMIKDIAELGDNIYDQIISIIDRSPNKSSAENLKKYIKSFHSLDSLSKSQEKLRLTTGASYNFNNSNQSEATNVRFNTSFGMGNYPWNFQIGLATNFGRTDESFSQSILQVAGEVNRWMHDSKYYSVKNHSYFNIYNNNLIDLKSRVEVGNTFRINLFGGLTEEGSKNSMNLKGYSLESLREDVNESIKVCIDNTNCANYPNLSNITNVESNHIANEYNLRQNVNSELHGRGLMGISIGALYELEKINDKNNLEDEYGNTLDTTIIFEPTHALKLETAFHFMYKMTDWLQFKGDWSIKYPITGNQDSRLTIPVENNNSLKFLQPDIRSDIKLNMQIKFEKNASINIETIVMKDFGSPSVDIQEEGFNMDATYLYKSPQSFIQSNIKFALKF